jgi:hypothetical protein
MDDPLTSVTVNPSKIIGQQGEDLGMEMETNEEK